MVRLVFVLKAVCKTLIIALVALFFSEKLVTADPPATELEERRKSDEAQMKALRDRISKAEEKVQKLKADEASVAKELERLNQELNKSRRTLSNIRGEIDRLEQEIASLKANRKALGEEIQTFETYAAPRLVAFYKLGQLGIAPVLFSAESVLGLLQRRQSLERILEYDAKLWDELQSQKERLDVISQTLEAQKMSQDRLFLRSKNEEARITEKRTHRAKLLATIRADKDLTLASIESLKKAAKELDETIRSLQRDFKPPSASTQPLAKQFVALKGSLPLPVQGKITGRFGPYVLERGHYNIKSFRSGVNIKAPLDAPVRAVCGGQVIYAGWFKGYGNIIIIDHGEHYYTLSARLERLLKKKGDPVLAGETIGTFGDVASLTGSGLYFEIRHHGKPVDPMLWFKKRAS